MPARLFVGAIVLVLLCALCGMAISQARTRRKGRREVQHPAVGETLEDFELKDIEGNPVKLSDFKGRIFVLELGACT